VALGVKNEVRDLCFFSDCDDDGAIVCAEVLPRVRLITPPAEKSGFCCKAYDVGQNAVRSLELKLRFASS
jgi:hypothetical protein